MRYVLIFDLVIHSLNCKCFFSNSSYICLWDSHLSYFSSWRKLFSNSYHLKF